METQNSPKYNIFLKLRQILPDGQKQNSKLLRISCSFKQMICTSILVPLIKLVPIYTVCIYIHTHIHVELLCMPVCVHVYTFMYMCILMYMCICICTHTGVHIDSQSLISDLVLSTSPGNLLDMLTSCLKLRPTDSETLRVGPSNVQLTSPPGGSDGCLSWRTMVTSLRKFLPH